MHYSRDAKCLIILFLVSERLHPKLPKPTKVISLTLVAFGSSCVRMVLKQTFGEFFPPLENVNTWKKLAFFNFLLQEKY